MNNKVKTRVPPSPTGNMNLGTARMALFNYLFAKKNNGEVILRFEDTDKARNKKEFEENIIQSLDWLGIKYDATYKQSERTEVYKEQIEKMIANGFAYISKETEGERSEVIRFKNPNKVITFTDSLRGEISIDTTDLGDFVIARAIDDPLYHLTVVVDDFLMEITHVIRGEDGIANTPRQILIQEAIGARRPLYTHMPMVLGDDKKKLSKRHGAKPIFDYKEEGYLQEALINYLAFLGWNPGDNREFFSMEELIKEFSLEKIQKSGAVFNIEKLKWYNKYYLSKKDSNELKDEIKSRIESASLVLDNDLFERLLPTILERISVYSDLQEMIDNGDFSYYTSKPDYDLEKILWKEENLENTLIYLRDVKDLLEKSDFSSKEAIKESIWDYASEKGRGNVLWPLRYVLSGKDKSPDPFELSYIIGKAEALNRINYAISKIQS